MSTSVGPTRGPRSLPLIRFALVVSSLAPLFLLWAIRGTPLVPDRILIPLAVLAIALPHLVLVIRMWRADDARDRHELDVRSSEDHRNDVLVYLFAILVPLYAIDASSWRDVVALLAAVGFIAFLFLHLNLNYMNVFFAIAGYNVFTIQSSGVGEAKSIFRSRVLISKRESLPTGRLVALRLSDTVFWEP